MNIPGRLVDLESRGVAPMPNGRFRPCARLPMVRRPDDEFDGYRRRGSVAALPLVVDRRFLSEARTARVVSTHFSDEFHLALTESVWAARYLEIVGNDNEWIILSLRLSGETLESVGGRHYRIDGQSGYMVHYARGMSHVLRAQSDEPINEACLTFSPDMLAGKLGLSRAQLLEQLSPAQLGGNRWFSRCELTPRMDSVIHELRAYPVLAPEYRMFAEAKSMELTALYVAELRAQCHPGRIGAGAVSRDLKRLRQVRRFLDEHYHREPRLDELCRMVGFNRRKLTSAFKREFGRTVYDYHHQVRMDIAKALFRGGCANVSLVAEQVGYSYAGNFSKAFRRHTGLSPKTYIKRIAAS